MAGQDRTSAPALAPVFEALRAVPHRFGFFAALRRLECAARDRPRLGESRHPSQDPVRLSQEPSLAFAPSVIAALRRDKGAATPRLVSRFLGLFGPNGPLPLHLTEHARQRSRNFDDPTFARFADIFHHRLLSLFYRAFAAAEPAVSRDRPESDRFATYVGSLVGVGSPALLARESTETLRLFYAGRFAAQPRNAAGLAAILADHFGVPARIEELVGQWVGVPADARWRLGGDAPLGLGASIGTRAWTCQGKFRVVLGPLARARRDDFLPGSEGFARLRTIVGSYAGDALDWDVRLITEGSQPWSLGEQALGWTTALGGADEEQASVIVEAPAS